MLIFKQHELSQEFQDAFEWLEEIGIGELLHPSAILIDEGIVVKKIVVVDEREKKRKEDCGRC